MSINHNDYERISSSARNNKATLQNDNICGCYHCLRIFPTCEIDEYCIDNGEETTAICPHCDVDSIISESSGYPLTDELLRSMRGHAFG